MDIHQQSLTRLCRVCGLLLTKPKKVPNGHKCVDFQRPLQDAFNIDITADRESVHPTHFCHSCRGVLYSRERAKLERREYQQVRLTVFKWEEHQPECKVCQHMSETSKGGRRRKTARPGRPLKQSPRAAITHIKSIAPESIVDTSQVRVQQTDFSSDLTCLICLNVVDRPIVLSTCSSLVCAECCCEWLRQTDTLSCPCCYGSHFKDFSSIRKAESLTLKLLRLQMVKCNKCQQSMKLEQHSGHASNGCSAVLPSILSPSVSIEDVLAKNGDTPLTGLEQKLQTALVKRTLSSSNSKATLQVKTGGQPLTFMQVSTPRVASSAASRVTVRRRSSELQAVRKRVSRGDNTTQLCFEISSREVDRKEIMNKLESLPGNLQIKIPADQVLAMKVDLQIPWRKLRLMRKWISSFGRAFASEKKMRERAEELLDCDNLKTELGPFTVQHKDGEEVKYVPVSYVPNLWQKVEDSLEQNDGESAHRLVWHGVIPKDEIWLKVGGDKGGGSFKMNFQIVNVPHPNSPENTCVFCIFEASDTLTNLHISLDKYKDQVTDLDSQTWRGKRIRVFLSGDYEFLTRIYGLSGASGRHFCLWCLIKSDDLKQPSNSAQERSIESIIEDHQRFVQAGAILKNAKLFNNAINEPFFKLPLSQVSPPGLHITLGIFYRLFSLLEDDCHRLDIKVLYEDSADFGGWTFSQCAKAVEEQLILRQQAENTQKELTELAELATLLTLFTDPEDPDERLKDLYKEILSLKKKLEELENQKKELDNKANKGFAKTDGPFVKGLDVALASFNVQRQSYYSGTFVGNHVHRTLKEDNLKSLCEWVNVVGRKFSTPIESEAQDVARRHLVAFQLFRECHNIYDQVDVSEADIKALGKNIESFMTYYRSTFPKATITPKLHMLECHVLPWIKKWRVGFGLMGEQGAESIHAYFNSLQRTYQTMPDGVQRLHHMMKEHFLHISPHNISACPPTKKRPRKAATITS